MTDTSYKFKTRPYTHQIEAFETAKDQPAFAWLMEMGTGKTKVALDNAMYLMANNEINGVLILAPKSMYHQWPEQMDAHCDDKIRSLFTEYIWSPAASAREERDKAICLTSPRSWLTMNIEALSSDKGFQFAKKFVEKHKTLMIVDEGSTIKTRLASRTKRAVILGSMSDYRRLLNGAPITHGPLDLWSQFAFLDGRILGGSYYGFRGRYAVMQKKFVGGGRSIDVVVGYKRLAELKKAIEPYSYRVTKAECLDLPLKIYETVHAHLTGPSKAMYSDLRDQFICELEGMPTITVDGVLPRLMKLRQLLCGFIMTEGKALQVPGSERLNVLMETLEGVDGKVVIWCTFRESVAQIAQMLRSAYGITSTLCYLGGQTKEIRVETQAMFNNPQSPVRFLVGTTASGKYGLNLQEACNTVIYFDNSFDFDVRIQSEDRTHRIGQKHPVTYIDIHSPGTIDDSIRKSLKLKKNLADLITGDNVREWIV